MSAVIVMSKVLLCCFAASLALRPFARAAEPATLRIADLAGLKGLGTDDGAVVSIAGSIVAKTDQCQILDDGSGRIMVYCDKTDMPFVAGDRIQATCTVWRRDENGALLAGRVQSARLIAHGMAPQPIDVDASEIVAGKHALHLVRTRGIVTHAFRDEVDTPWLDFVVETPHSHFIAVLNDQHAMPMDKARAMIDREVVLTGIANSPIGHSNPHAVDMPCLVLRSFGDIRVASAPTLPPDERPHRRPFTGTVIAPCGESSFFLSLDDGSRNLKVRLCAEEKPVAAGERVTVAGFVHRNSFLAWLDNAVVRARHGYATALPRPVPVSIGDIVSDAHGTISYNLSYQGALVRFVGRVADIALSEKGVRFAYLENGGTRVPICLGDIPPPAVDSKVAVSGCCLIVTETDDGPARFCRFKGVEIFPRDADDIEVVAGPPWWTPLRLAVVILCLFLTLIGISIWNRLLKNIIARQSNQLVRTRLARERSALRTKERTMLAIELHDSLSQNLTGVGLQLTASRRARPTDPDAADRHVAAALRILKSSRSELDRCIQDLRGHALDEPDFTTAIRQTLGPAYGETLVTIRFYVDRNRLDDRTAHAVLRIIRELVANAVSHGHATQIRVAGEISTGALKFSVADNGTGFPDGNVPGAAEGHFGLAGIRERVKDMNGSVDIRSRLGAGARVAVVVPHPEIGPAHDPNDEKD